MSWRHVTSAAGSAATGATVTAAADAVALVPHPAAPPACSVAIAAEVERTAAALTLTYTLRGALDRLRLPAAGALRLGRDLWRQTCFEAFLRRADAAAYVELNFAPSRAWALHAFTATRQGGPVAAPAWAPALDVTRAADTFSLRAALPLERLAPGWGIAPLALALAAVLEGDDGSLSYWALHHPAARPDFHHPGGFTLRLPAPER